VNPGGFAGDVGEEPGLEENANQTDAGDGGGGDEETDATFAPDFIPEHESLLRFRGSRMKFPNFPQGLKPLPVKHQLWHD
jgi:hypothetical protein